MGTDLLKIPAWLMPTTTLLSAGFMMALICGGYLIVATSSSLPDAQSIKQVELKVPLRVFSSEGLLISEFGDERRKRIDLKDTPKALVDAVLASEDDNFYNHGGIDFRGLLRAAISNFRSGGTQGASTITMQVARNFFLSREQTYERKLKEVLLSLKLEQILSKDDILELYLNKIFLGHRSYGFGAAADVYYDRNLDELSLAELAMLAGLPKAPSSNNPISNPQRSVIRRNYVLRRMLDLAKISQEQFDLASNAEITAARHGRNGELWAPHIAEMVRATLTEKYGSGVYWSGLNVYTTIKAQPQNAAQRSLRSGLQAYDKRHGFRGPISRVDVGRLAPSGTQEQARFASFNKHLAQFPDSLEQKPALITSTEKNLAQAHIKDYGPIVLHLEDSKWAKRHISANKVSDTPKSMEELVSEGDIVYVTPIFKAQEKQVAASITTDTQSEPTPTGWQLSQIPNIGGAIISIEPSTGRILSLVGGYDFFINKYNRAVQSIRQPGSNIKPFIYSLALDKGFTPSSLISGAPIVITDPVHGTVWRPENYSGKFFGPTRMREALAKSMNLVSIRLLRAIGTYDAKEYLERFGLDTNRFASSLTMALGSGGVSPLELLGAYGALANGGYQIKPYFIDHITNREGEVVFQTQTPSFCDECYQQFLPKDESQIELEQANAALDELNQAEEATTAAVDVQVSAEDRLKELDTLTEPVLETYEAPRVMNQANNFLIVNMMKDVIKRGTGRKALALNRTDLAGKTGTTNDYIDAWFTGFNSKIATTVWIGFDDPQTMGRGEAGSVAALPVWIDYMKDVLDEIPADLETVPDFIEKGLVNRETGLRTDESDPDSIEEYFAIAELLPEPMGDSGIQQQLELDERSELGQDDTIDGVLDQNDNPFSESTDVLEPPTTAPIIIEEAEETEGLF